MGNSLAVEVDKVEGNVIQYLDKLAEEIHYAGSRISTPGGPLLFDGGWTGKAAESFIEVYDSQILEGFDMFRREMTLLAVVLRTALEEIKQADLAALVMAGEFQDAIDAVKDFENL